MKIPQRHYSKTRGFTVVELLTTIAIIGILIGLLIPALGLIRKTAFKVKQKSQFNTIAIGLEAYQLDFGVYPPSSHLDSGPELGYGGAQKLAEALVGWDAYGVHPKTEFRPDGMADINNNGFDERIYIDGVVITVTTDITDGNTGQVLLTAQENRQIRKGPYLELEAANAVRLSDIYDFNGSTVLPNVANEDNYVLTDMFGKVTNKTTGRKTGMPILYYKANRNGIHHDHNIWNFPSPVNTYEVRDNMPFFESQAPFGNNPAHPLRVSAGNSTAQVFYDRTANPNFPSSDIPSTRRPYRSESYILHSAGPDGLYGTMDDIFNFDTEQSGF